MARINIEEKWWSDPRRMMLTAKLGLATADGVWMNAVRMAQDHGGEAFDPRGKLLPEWVDALLSVGLADGEQALIYIKGAKEHHAWLVAQRERARKGGLANAKRTLKPSLKQTLKPTQANAEPSSSSSSSDSKKNLNTNTIATASHSPTPVGVYVDAYQARYNHRPEIGPREGKILKTFAQNHPERWPQLIEGYLKMPDTWSTARSHPVEGLVGKVNEIGRFLATGKVVTQKVIRDAEEMIDRAQGSHRKPRRSPEEIERERTQMLSEAAEPKKIGSAS